MEKNIIKYENRLFVLVNDGYKKSSLFGHVPDCSGRFAHIKPLIFGFLNGRLNSGCMRGMRLTIFFPIEMRVPFKVSRTIRVSYSADFFWVGVLDVNKISGQ